MVYKVELFELGRARAMQLSEETERSSFILPHYLGAFVFLSMARNLAIESRASASGLLVPTEMDMALLDMPSVTSTPLIEGGFETRTADTVAGVVANALVAGRTVREAGYDSMFPIVYDDAPHTPEQARILADVEAALQSSLSKEDPERKTGMYL